VTQEEAYDEVCRIAREHALIWQAAGGVVTIVHPDVQREEGLYDQIQRMHGKKIANPPLPKSGLQET